MRYPGEDLDDAADRLYGEWRQQMVDAYAEGLRVGRLGLGAGLCPDGTDDERNEWLRGFRNGAAEITNRRRAA